jgi:receptor protein-tyrosine kinase
LADGHERSDIRAALRVLHRQWLVVAICLAVATAGALELSLRQTKEYSATSSLLFRDPGFDQKLFGTSFFAPSTDAQREAATNVKLVSLQVVAARSRRALATALTASELQNKVDVSAEGDSNVVSITATDHRPSFAAALANTFAQEYIAFRRDADRQKIKQAQELVQRQIARLSPRERGSQQGRGLVDRVEQLAILASLQTGNAEQVQPAGVPSSPSSPNVRRKVALGAALGLLLGLGLAFLLDRLDRRIRDPEELEDAFRLPLVGAIPKSRAFAASKTASGIDASGLEAFAMLHAKLRYFNVDREVRSLVVTSAEPRDGKTTVAWFLAAAAARQDGARVLLIEADLRRPTIAHQRLVAPFPGLAELLTQDVDFAEVVQIASVASLDGGVAPVEFDVVVAGAVPPNPMELLQSRKMADLLEMVSATYDLVVLDTPPITAVSDAIPLIARASGVLVVGRLAKTSRDSAARMRDQLIGLGAPTLGVVANEANGREYGYYGYVGPDRVPGGGAANGRGTPSDRVKDRLGY